jgi:hypothetical protein
MKIKYLADKLNVTPEVIYAFCKHKNKIIENNPEYELPIELHNLLIEDYLCYYKKKLNKYEYEIIYKNVNDINKLNSKITTNISEPIKRLSTVATELNVNITTLKDFLLSKGYADINRNSKLSHVMYQMLQNRFADFNIMEEESINITQYSYSKNEEIKVENGNPYIDNNENELNPEEIRLKTIIDLSIETKIVEKTVTQIISKNHQPEKSEKLVQSAAKKVIDEEAILDSKKNSISTKSNESSNNTDTKVDNLANIKQLLKSERYSNFKLNDIYITTHYFKIIDASYKELTIEQVCQVLIYIRIYKRESYTEHWQVNRYISNQNLWDYFSELRSLNDHGHPNKIKGITPFYFALICRVLEINADDGEPLLDYEEY